MNTSELKKYLEGGQIVSRFQSVSASALRWLKKEAAAGRVLVVSDGFANPRPIYAAPGVDDARFRRAAA